MSKENKNIVDDELTLTLKRSELFQIHLSLVCRSAAATQKWCNATSADEQNVLQGTIQYLTNLTEKLDGVLKNGKK